MSEYFWWVSEDIGVVAAGVGVVALAVYVVAAIWIAATLPPRAPTRRRSAWWVFFWSGYYTERLHKNEELLDALADEGRTSRVPLIIARVSLAIAILAVLVGLTVFWLAPP